MYVNTQRILTTFRCCASYLSRWWCQNTVPRIVPLFTFKIANTYPNLLYASKACTITYRAVYSVRFTWLSCDINMLACSLQHVFKTHQPFFQGAQLSPAPPVHVLVCRLYFMCTPPLVWAARQWHVPVVVGQHYQSNDACGARFHKTWNGLGSPAGTIVTYFNILLRSIA